jgi:hypothetical protein
MVPGMMEMTMTVTYEQAAEWLSAHSTSFRPSAQAGFIEVPVLGGTAQPGDEWEAIEMTRKSLRMWMGY